MENYRFLTGAFNMATGFSVGLVTGLCLRDEYMFPTFYRIKNAVIEYYSSIREIPPKYLFDIIDVKMDNKQKKQLFKEFQSQIKTGGVIKMDNPIHQEDNTSK